MEKFNPFPLADLARIAPVLVLFATATAALVLDLFLRSWYAPRGKSPAPAGGGGKWLLPAVSLAGTAVALLVTLPPIRDGRTAQTVFGGALRIDPFSDAVTGIILVGTFLTVASAIGYLKRLDIEHGEFHALLLYAAGSMVLLAQSNDLIMVFVSLETFSMAVYVLTAYTRDAQRSVEGALKYFVLGGVSSGFLLLGLAFIYGASGELRLDAIGRALADPVGAARVDPALLLAGLGLSLVGFGFKVGAFPFHSWIPDAYEGAPGLVTGFMSVTVKTAAFAVLVRFALTLTRAPAGAAEPAALGYATDTLWWLAIATMAFGNLVALVQTSVKRMLAYSAISHTGYLLVGLVAALALSGEPGDGRGAPILFYLFPYTLMTFGSFAVLAGLGREAGEHETFESFQGLSRRRPFLAFVLLVFMASLAGIPPTAGFWGKFYLFRDAVQAGEWPLALAGVLASLISVYYYLRLVVVMYMQPADPERQPERLFECSWGAALATALAAAGIVGIGLLPGEFLDLSIDSVRGVVQAPGR